MEIPYWAGMTDKLLLLLSMYAAMLLYSMRVEKRGPGRAYFYFAVAASVGLCFLSETAKKYLDFGMLSYISKNSFDIFILIVCIFAMCLIRRYDRASGLFIACAAYATISLANNGYALLSAFFTGPSSVLQIRMPWEIVVRAVLFFAVYSAVYLLSWHVFVKRQRIVDYAVDKSVYGLILIIFVINLFLGAFQDNMAYVIILLGRLLFCLLILFVLFRQANYLNLREENARLQVMMEQQKSQYSLAKENIEQVNIKAHDIKHFAELFRQSGQVPAQLVSALDEVCQQYGMIYHTGSKALDTTLAEKSRNYPGERIEFSAIADGAALSFMSDVDVYVLFGNILDNAREAVIGIEDEQNRIISLSLRRTEQGVSLHAENTYAQKPVFFDGMPRTSKNDEVNHGFGTKSIRAVVEKYHGNMTMDCDDQLFTVDIIFFNQT